MRVDTVAILQGAQCPGFGRYLSTRQILNVKTDMFCGFLDATRMKYFCSVAMFQDNTKQRDLLRVLRGTMLISDH